MTLALGITATTVVYSVLDSAVLRPFPYPDLERIVTLRHWSPETEVSAAVSAPTLRDWQSDALSFETLGANGSARLAVTGVPFPAQIRVSLVSEGWFRVFGVRPAQGRAFRTAEHRPGRAQVAIVSDAFWTNQLGGAPDSIGEAIVVDGRTVTVVGVLSAKDFSSTAIFMPLAFDTARFDERGAQRLGVYGLLADGVTVQRAQIEVDMLSERLRSAYPHTNADLRTRVDRYADTVVSNYEDRLWMTFGAVVLVLLTACLNVAGLQAVHVTNRWTEIRTQAALGATAGVIGWQQIIRGVALCTGGGLMALVMAAWSIRTVASVGPPTLFRFRPPQFSGELFALALALTAVSTILAGVLPALWAERTAVASSIAASEFKHGGSARGRARRTLVTIQVALSVVLLAGAGVVVDDLRRQLSADLGFDAGNKLVTRIDLPRPQYQSRAARLDFVQSARDHLLTLPGIESVEVSNYVPFDRYTFTTLLSVDGLDHNPFAESPTIQYRVVTPGYFRLMDIPVLRGRPFEPEDASGPGVAIISEGVRRRLFGQTAGLGRRIDLHLWNPTGSRAGDTLEMTAVVVGVVGDVLEMRFAGDPRSTVYLPYAQHPDSTVSFIIARHDGIGGDGARDIRGALAAVAPSVAVASVDLFEALVGRLLADEQFLSGTLGLFAFLAVFLASVGLYGVVAQGVTHKSRDLAIRVALGASERNILRLVLRDVAGMALIGIACGCVAAVWVRRLLLAIDVVPVIPGSVLLLVVSLLMMGTLLLAASPQLWRASRLDVVTILREQ